MTSIALNSRAGPVAVALLATVATLATLAPGTTGPGVTCDELYHVAVGKNLVSALRHQGPGFFAPGNIRRNFPWTPDGPPVHPPLGNWILGCTHHLFDPAPDNPSVISIAAARFAPALAFGLLVLIVGLWTAQAEGALAGTVAAAAVLLVPRLFAHAHLAALDMLTTLFFVAAVLAVAEAARREGRWGYFALAGVVWGLALLTRMHGLLLLPPIAVWLCWRMGRRAAGPLAAWFAAGILTMFAGWPWLWLEPLDHLRQYLCTATGRQAINLFYLGEVWADRDVPWHYPWVMLVVALPAGLLLLGAAGLWSRCRQWKSEPGLTLVVSVAGFVLLVFTWPGVPVYDGVRLFLMVFPLWAIMVGVGAKWTAEHQRLGRLSFRFRVAAVGLFVALQGIGLVAYHPCQLSHYSLLVGGLGGADRLGFEATYWGDSIRESLLADAARLADSEVVLFGPNLAPFQAPAVRISSPALMRSGVNLVGWDPNNPPPASLHTYAVIYHRKADLTQVAGLLDSGRVVAEYNKQGVWLVRVVEIGGK